ncbi:unnamed protein product [Lepeophtheirus salmonis]|uniref:(salmon louse) hypothetical protein n=1 Tax=Lepeophtheirus salmonis TaxID=72036 RepID=A0A7R8D2K5_LEPSM|nr:unnamed protein product [Lepeophtheirus salmonis]CAF2977240.1 unnamed protein product [Lepeophtheirus salmonis]
MESSFPTLARETITNLSTQINVDVKSTVFEEEVSIDNEKDNLLLTQKTGLNGLQQTESFKKPNHTSREASLLSKKNICNVQNEFSSPPNKIQMINRKDSTESGKIGLGVLFQ